MMSKEILIADAEITGFTPQAAADLQDSIKSYKDDLLQEIWRIEAGQNAGSGVPEITSRMVKDAEVIFSRGSIYSRKKTSIKVLKFIAVISLFAAGAMIQKDMLKDFSYLLALGVVFSIAIGSNILVYMRD